MVERMNEMPTRKRSVDRKDRKMRSVKNERTPFIGLIGRPPAIGGVIGKGELGSWKGSNRASETD